MSFSGLIIVRAFKRYVQRYWVIFSLGPGDYSNMSLSSFCIVYLVKWNASVLLMFILSLGPGDYINMSLSGPAIVLAVTIDVQHYSILFLLEGRGSILLFPAFINSSSRQSED